MKKRKPNPKAKPNPDPSGLNYRAAGSGFATLNEAERSVEVVVATEAPVKVYDYEKGRVISEVLLASGCEFPDSGQVVMLDSHQRWDTATVIGSCRALSIETDQVIGRAHFSSVPEAQSPWTKTLEGHLTDYSAGYNVKAATWINEGETATINGREYKGPLSVVTSWSLRELSACPIGADAGAKARAADYTPANPLTLSKEDRMNKTLRELLQARGLAPEATVADAWKFFDTLENRSEVIEALATPATGEAIPATIEIRSEPTPEVSVADAIADERTRAAEIRGLGQRFDCIEATEIMILEGESVDQARTKVLELVEASRVSQADPAAGFTPARVIVDQRDKFRAAAQDAIMVRAGLEVATPAAGHDELTGYSMVELARESLRMSNQPTSGNVMEMTGRALTTSDFPLLLANIANKSLAVGYAGAEETWPQIFNTASVSDFKTNTRVRASETDDLEEVKELGEFKHGSQTEGKEEYSIATYGKLYGISRQAIINDDLSALADIPRRHGEAAARKIGDVAYAVLSANAAMGDGVALFHANHSNLGTSGVISVTTLAEAIKKMKLQKDLKGLRRLNIRPQFLLAPVALEGAGEQFFSTVIDPGKSIPGVNNPYSGNYFTRVYEPRLDDASATAWYILGAKGKTVTLFFLNGVATPYMETRKGWDVDGVEYKVRIDAGAKALDWKAMIKNAGA